MKDAGSWSGVVPARNSLRDQPRYLRRWRGRLLTGDSRLRLVLPRADRAISNLLFFSPASRDVRPHWLFPDRSDLMVLARSGCSFPPIFGW